jgi:hypothetical protein
MCLMTSWIAPLSLIVAFALGVPAAALQAPPQGLAADSELFKAIATRDEALFDAYNRCDLDTFGSFFADDVEFYHDKSGLTLGRQRLIESVKTNICGKVRRELVRSSLAVYPMDGYGALQTGSHLFCEHASKRCEGIGRFAHLWQNANGVWKLTRVYSYDHKPNP